MRPDIEHSDDIRLIVDSFYQKAMQDEIIGHFFTEVMQLSLEEHLPLIYSFWESVLLNTATYRGNVMLKHIALHKKHALTATDFERWKSLFFETIDANFEGERTEEMKQKTTNMASLMLFKIDQSNNKNFIQ